MSCIVCGSVDTKACVTGPILLGAYMPILVPELPYVSTDILCTTCVAQARKPPCVICGCREAAQTLKPAQITAAMSQINPEYKYTAGDVICRGCWSTNVIKRKVFRPRAPKRTNACLMCGRNKRVGITSRAKLEQRMAAFSVLGQPYVYKPHDHICDCCKNIKDEKPCYICARPSRRYRVDEDIVTAKIRRLVDAAYQYQVGHVVCIRCARINVDAPCYVCHNLRILCAIKEETVIQQVLHLTGDATYKYEPGHVVCANCVEYSIGSNKYPCRCCGGIGPMRLLKADTVIDDTMYFTGMFICDDCRLPLGTCLVCQDEKRVKHVRKARIIKGIIVDKGDAVCKCCMMCNDNQYVTSGTIQAASTIVMVHEFDGVIAPAKRLCM